VNEQAQGQVPGVKRCTKCGIEKPLSEFGKSRGAPDGLNYWCRSCVNAQSNAYRQANREVYLATKKRNYDANREKILVRVKTYYKANQEAMLAKAKAYRQANSKTILAKANAYYDANREAVLAQKKIYGKANKEVLLARNNAYYDANKEAVLAQKRIYRAANIEAVRLAVKAWQERNPEQHAKHRRMADKRRRARKRGALVVRFTPAMEQAKYQEQNARCYYGNEELNGIYDIEHKVPLCRGGAHSPDNIVLACKSCNNQKGRMTDIEFFELSSNF
jgi:5-methylcytosine-specific restriction endonuclease McrA